MDSTNRGSTARLGKYSLVAEIARGGMGIVYLAQASGPHNFKKLVVVKELKPELAEDDKFREMFLDEARLAARLNHRNIVQTTEVDQDGERYYFVMEYLEGRTLHAVSRLKGDKALSTSVIIRVICDVLAGLHYAHELADFDGKPLNIVHRDVSPRNVFITYDGQVKLLDFGVAKAANRDQETEAGELKGRVQYMAPEHMTNEQIDRRSDVFSAGVLLREALLGTRLWEGHSEVEILRELLEKRVPPIPADADLADEAREIIDKAMAPERDDRYRTAHEMRTALERYVARIDVGQSFAKVGEHISKEFAEHRAQVRMLIEQHVANAESNPPPKGELPSLPTSAHDLRAATPASTSAANVSAPPPTPNTSTTPRSISSGRIPAVSAPPTAPSSPNMAAVRPPPPATSSQKIAAVVVPPSASSSAPNISVAPSSSSLVASSLAPASQSSSRSLVPNGSVAPSSTATPAKVISLPPPPKRSIFTYLLYAILFISVAGGLTVVLLSTREVDPTKPPPVDPTSTTPTVIPDRRPNPFANQPSPSASASAEAVELVEVTVHASPPIARIWIDDVLVGQGPHTAKYKRGSRHVIHATAPGYVAKSEPMLVNATASVTIQLEKEAGAGPVVIPPRPPPPRPPPPRPTNPPPPTPHASTDLAPPPAPPEL